MFRLLRFFLGTLGIMLFVVAAIRAVQPAEPSGNYLTLVASRYGNSDCCVVYMVSARQKVARQISIAANRQTYSYARMSASGAWRYLQVETATGYHIYLKSLLPGPDEWLLLPPEAGLGQYFFWSSHEDVLYYLARDRGNLLAVFRVDPAHYQDKPERLTDYRFTQIRNISEQTPPRSSYSPLIPFFLSINVLIVAGGMKLWEKA